MSGLFFHSRKMNPAAARRIRIPKILTIIMPNFAGIINSRSAKPIEKNTSYIKGLVSMPASFILESAKSSVPADRSRYTASMYIMTVHTIPAIRRGKRTAKTPIAMLVKPRMLINL